MPLARRSSARAAQPKPVPMRTPITKLGLTPADARKLTPAARKLTKADLLAMMAGKTPRAAQELTLRDLTSISTVYAAAMRRPDPFPGCCCCCTPCCCCCAVDIAID